MYFPDFWSIADNLDLRKTVSSVLQKNLDFLREMYKRNIDNFSPPITAHLILENSLARYTPKEITPEMSQYLSRLALRNLVGLPPLEMNTKEREAIKKLEGSISWMTKEKIDVTDFIREIRERE